MKQQQYKQMGWRPGTRQLEHRAIAKKILGRPLRGTECVHHVDGNGRNNALENLVICPSKAYHNLLHMRERALDASGNVTFRKCQRCGDYGDPTTMWRSSRTGYAHPDCKRAYLREWRRRKKGVLCAS